jgi:hypothetical protein
LKANSNPENPSRHFSSFARPIDALHSEKIPTWRILTKNSIGLFFRKRKAQQKKPSLEKSQAHVLTFFWLIDFDDTLKNQSEYFF